MGLSKGQADTTIKGGKWTPPTEDEGAGSMDTRDSTKPLSCASLYPSGQLACNRMLSEGSSGLHRQV